VTYSIVARDPASGQFGVAVQSHWFSVGSQVCWAQAGVGAAATQATIEPGYGPLGLGLMRDGSSASEALLHLVAADPGEALRQVAMVDAEGRAAAHTGGRCIEEAGHVVGEGFSAQANMMAGPDVWPAMARAYAACSGGFPERLLAALDGAQAAGGDIRGRQSAAILIVAAQPSGRPWEDTLMDLRVEDHPEPLAELRRLIRMHHAYDLMNRGDQDLGAGDVESALACYRSAATMLPARMELPFWHAVTLADLGRLDEALPIFQVVFDAEPAWATLVQRLPKAGLLRSDADMMRRILALAG
jgi:uncharacterized Ntn-hydrolase superfamily protein